VPPQWGSTRETERKNKNRVQYNTGGRPAGGSIVGEDGGETNRVKLGKRNENAGCKLDAIAEAHQKKKKGIDPGSVENRPNKLPPKGEKRGEVTPKSSRGGRKTLQPLQQREILQKNLTLNMSGELEERR